MPSWKRSFAALWVAEFLAIAGFATTNPILPLYIKELGVTDPVALNWWTGAINGFSNLALALFAPIWGALADSYGKKPMLLRAMFGGAMVMGFLALTTSPWQVLTLKILQGCITGTVAAATVLTAAIVPEAEVGYRLGLIQMAVFVGNSFGPMFGGFVTDLAGSRVNFLATSAFLFVAAFIVIRQVQEDTSSLRRTGSLLKNAVPDLRVLRTTAGLSALVVVIFIVQFAGSVTAPIIPLVVLDMSGGAGGGVGSLSGLIIGAASVAGAAGAVLVGKVAAGFGYGRTLLWCIVGSFAFYVPQGFANQPWQLLVLRFFSGFFMGGTMPAVNALIALRAEKSRQGAVYGLATSISSLGNALGPVFGAFAASTIGYPAVFFATSAFLGFLGLLILRAPRSGAPEPRRPQVEVERAAPALRDGEGRTSPPEDGP